MMYVTLVSCTKKLSSVTIFPSLEGIVLFVTNGLLGASAVASPWSPAGVHNSQCSCVV